MFEVLSVGAGSVKEVDFFEDFFKFLVEFFNGAVVFDVIVGDGDGAAFFKVFNFGPVAGVGLFGGEGAVGAVGEAGVAEVFVGDDGHDGDFARELVFQDAVFAPSVETVKDDFVLSGGD